MHDLVGQAHAPAAQPIPESIAGSPLLRRGGFMVLDDLLNPAALRSLREESARHLRQAAVAQVARSDNAAGRGGNPARCFWQASGGAAQDDFYRHPRIAALLGNLCGAPVTTTGHRGTFSYYTRPGHHLALHLDIETCDVSLITCVYATAAGQRGLYAYPARRHEPLFSIRATPRDGLTPVALRPGQSVALLGGIVPHCVLPLSAGQVRVVSVLCYRALTMANESL
jgi:hypothetical protein